jgi:hypothetical protein
MLENPFSFLLSIKSERKRLIADVIYGIRILLLVLSKTSTINVQHIETAEKEEEERTKIRR